MTNFDTVKKIMKSANIPDEVITVSEPNQWIMQSQKVSLSSGRVLLLKVGINDEWTDEAAILNQVCTTSLLKDCNVPQPEILAYSCEKSEFGFRFLLSEAHTGTKLLDLYESADSYDRLRLFEALAHTYSKIHSKKNTWNGVWAGSPAKSKYPIHPARFYSMAEINGGSGLALYEKGMIGKALFDALCDAWDSHLPYLEQREASLVHISPFPWCIYLLKNEGTYKVTGFTALGDFMWWDAMSDLAHLLYPPFMDISDAERDAFLHCYTGSVDLRAISLYRLLNRVCAISGVYRTITSKKQHIWINKEIARLPTLIEKIKSCF